VLGPLRFPLQVVKRVPCAFDGEDWLFEIKHDGFRVLAIKDDGAARLYTRNGYDISRRHRDRQFESTPLRQAVFDFWHSPEMSSLHRRLATTRLWLLALSAWYRLRHLESSFFRMFMPSGFVLL
jgi:hypothetical protein